MKKFFAVVAVAALSLGAVSCGEKKAEETVANTTDSLAAQTDSLAAKTDSVATKVEGAVNEVAPATTEAPAKDAPAK